MPEHGCKRLCDCLGREKILCLRHLPKYTARASSVLRDYRHQGAAVSIVELLLPRVLRHVAARILAPHGGSAMPISAAASLACLLR